MLIISAPAFYELTLHGKPAAKVWLMMCMFPGKDWTHLVLPKLQLHFILNARTTRGASSCAVRRAPSNHQSAFAMRAQYVILALLGNRLTAVLVMADGWRAASGNSVVPGAYLVEFEDGHVKTMIHPSSQRNTQTVLQQC